MSDSEQLGDLRNSRSARRLSHGKRWLFRSATAVLSMVIVELISLAIWIVFPPLIRADLLTYQEQVAALGTERRNDLEVIHPYLGWAFNPEAADPPADLRGPVTVNSLGLVDSGPTIQRRSPDRIVIGVLGGSVAQQMTTIGEQAFRDRLSASPALHGREIQIVRLAMSGYKQPQQLMALNYVMVLGGEFDVVVNIDGFNETGLVVGENDVFGVFAAYPRGWQARLQDVVDPRDFSISYRLLQIRATRQTRAQWILHSVLRHTWTASLIWAEQDVLLRNEQTGLRLELMKHAKKEGRGFARDGPRQMYSNNDEMYRHLTELWSNSSLQIQHLCSGRGIRYLHFLQPNQYVPNSKTLSRYELEECYNPHELHAEAIVKGYPRLINAGAKLRESGVSFHDLTQLFAGESETIYGDYFCHYNKRGTDMLAEAVAAKIIEAVDPR